MRPAIDKLSCLFLLLLIICSSMGASAATSDGQIMDDPADATNWAGSEHGAKFSAGAGTQFLGDNDVQNFAAGRGSLIFRHGPRGLEKVIIVELSRPVLVRSVVFGTAIDDVVRVPTAAEVYLSQTGEAGSYTLAGQANEVYARRTLVAIDPPARARWVKFSFKDTSGGSRITFLGVFSATPEVVRARYGGFDKPTFPVPGSITIDEINRGQAQYGTKGDIDLTFHCGAIEYASPPPPGAGTLLQRFISEDSHIRRQLEKLQVELPVYRALGVTAMETYVRWNLVEEQPGVYDFSVYDELLRLFEQNGLKWTPYIVLGPAYTLPEWFRQSDEYVPFRCLEHGRDNAVVSIWDPQVRKHVARFLRAFSEHYRKRDSVQQVMIGISGLYGENLYPHFAQNDWTTNTTGDYHAHWGWWCGDEYARRDFQRWLSAKYHRIERLNRAWRSEYVSFAQIAPQPPERFKSNRAKVDFQEWYLGAMTGYLEFWLRTARKYLPETKLCAVTGGFGLPIEGADFSAAAKVAARYRAGLRITNEGDNFAENVALTRWLTSAGRFYGAWFGTEPAALQIEESSVAARVFNATTSGAQELFCYPTDLTRREDYLKLVESLPYLRQRKPVIATAFWLPRTNLMVADELDYIGEMRKLREAMDFDVVDGPMIRDGALGRYRVLVMGLGNIEEARVLKRIYAWLRKGGILIRLQSGPLTTVEGATVYQDKLEALQVGVQLPFGEMRKIGRGYLITVPATQEESLGEAADWALTHLRDSSLPQLLRRVPGVYCCRMEDGLLLLNINPTPVEVSIGFAGRTQTVNIAGQSIVSLPRE